MRVYIRHGHASRRSFLSFSLLASPEAALLVLGLEVACSLPWIP
jgi:hypothetical protein